MNLHICKCMYAMYLKVGTESDRSIQLLTISGMSESSRSSKSHALSVSHAAELTGTS